MDLSLEITAAWQSTNDAGGALASALHARRSHEVDTPVILRRPSQKVTAKDQLGEVLLLIAEAKRHTATQARRIEALENEIQKQLATR